MADEKKGEPDPKEPGPLPIPEEEKTPEEPGYGHGVQASGADCAYVAAALKFLFVSDIIF